MQILEHLYRELDQDIIIYYYYRGMDGWMDKTRLFI